MASETQAPASVTSEDQGGVTAAWANPENATASDNSRAIAAGITATKASQRLKAVDFGFSLPSDPVGFLVRFEKREQNNVNNGIRDNEVKLIVGGTGAGDNKASASQWATSDTVAEYGANNDLWGLTPTAADVNANDFGVGLIAQSSGLGSTGDAEVDYVEIEAFYADVPARMI